MKNPTTLRSTVAASGRFSVLLFVVATIFAGAILLSPGTEATNAVSTCSPAPPNLIAWYRAENNANDASGTNHGTLQNGTTFTAGKVGQAFSLDGINDQVSVPDNPSLNAQALTIEGWIKTPGGPAGNLVAFIAAKSGTNGLSGYELDVVTSEPLRGRLRITINGGAGGADLIGTPGSFVFDNQFHHVAATYDGNAMRLYIDGNLDSEWLVTTSINYQANSPLVIGRRQLTSFPGPFNGIIDDLSVFNRALSASEIQSIFDANDAGKCDPCTPLPSNGVSWYRAENDANDSVGSNNGTLQNGTTFAAGKVGQAFSLDGNDDSIQLPLNQTFQNFTLEAWVKPLSVVNDPINQELILGQASSGSQLVVLPGTDGGVRVRVQYRDTTSSFVLLISTTDIPLNDWSHLIGTFDGTTLKLYLNGVLNAQLNPPNTTVSTCNMPHFIGGFRPVTDCFNITNQPSQFFNGLIDEASIYDRALTQDEIQSIFSSDTAGKCLPVCTPAPANLESWYRGEGNANDFQGTNHGTLINGAGFAAAVVNQGFNLDGVNDFVRVGNPPALNFGTGDFSVQAWVKTSFRGGTFNDYIISKSNVGNDAQFVLSYNAGGTGFPSFLMSNGTTIYSASGTANLADGTFHHLAGVREGTTLRLYVDGVEVGTATTPSLVNATSANNVIIGGRDNPDFDPYFKGIIDEVQFFNRALSSAEIQSIFAAGSAGMCVPCTPLPSNAVSWYRAENDALDQQGNNNGTLQNGAGFAPGTVGQAFNLDGTNDYVDIGNLAQLDNASELTVMAWVKRQASVNTNAGIIGKWDTGGAPNNTFLFYMGEPSIQNKGFLVVGFDHNTFAAVGAQSDIPVDQWTFVAATWRNSDGVMKIYKNGVEDGSSVGGIGQTLKPHRAYTAKIGEWGVLRDSRYKFPGQIDEPAIFNRALSASEIQAIFNAGSAGICSSSTPLQISPTTQTVNIGGTVNFTATGGTPPYTFSLFANNSLATIDPPSGVYTAGTLVGTDTVRVTDALGLTADAAVTVSSGAPVRLAFIVQPMNATAGQPISPAVQVAIQDNAGNTVTNATDPVTIAIGNNPGGSTLSGNVTRNAVNGIATFDDLSLNRSGTGYELVAFSGSLATATSIAFNVDPGAASQLVFTVQPSNAKRSAIITPAIQVEVRDANGNLVTNSAIPVLLAIGDNPGGGSLQGSLAQPTVNGVATFADLRIVGGVGGHGYTLDATSAGLPSTTSNAFNIFGPTQLTFTVQPSNAKRSAIIAPAIKVEVHDENGDLVTDSQHVIQLFGSNFPGGGSLQGSLFQTTVNGVATFEDVRIVGGVGGHGYILGAFTSPFPHITSTPFNIFGPTQITFTGQPSNAKRSAIIAPAIKVEVRDENGDLVTDSQHVIQLFGNNFPGGGSLQGSLFQTTVNGVATFEDVRIVGGVGGHGYILGAFTSPFPHITSTPFNIFGPTQITFTGQPSNAKRSAIIAPAIKVEVHDENGDLVTDSQHVIQLFGSNFPGGGSLQGSLFQTTINGVATFEDVRIVGGVGGHGYILGAFTSPFPHITSTPFNIFGPTQITFTGQPSNAKRSAIIAPAIKVEVRDENGDLVTDSQHVIQLFGNNFPGGGSLQGSLFQTTVNGVATFEDVRIVGGVGGHGYILGAFTSPFPHITSTPFNIFGPTQITFTGQPSNAKRSAIIAPAIKVEVHDENGDLVTDSQHVIQLFGNNFPGGGSLQGSLFQTTVNGVATFEDVRIVGGVGGHGYILGAFTSPFPHITSTPFNIFGPTQISFTVQPSNATSNDIITPAVQVEVRDENGVLVTDSVHSINLVPGLFPGGGFLQGGFSQTVNGVGTFSNLSIVGGVGGQGYTLVATSTGLQQAISASFDILASPFVVTNTNDSGAGSLRQAILNANNTLGATISFNLPGTAPFTISPLTELPMVGPFTTINGTSQSGYAGSPIIELNGASAGTNAYGLRLTADGTVKGLAINRFGRAGMELGSRNMVLGNYIGTDITGSVARPNGEGIWIISSNNDITGNVVSGNLQKGIKILVPGNVVNNVIKGNYIGTSASGTAAVPNKVGISTIRSTIIGGVLAGEGNVIAFNSEKGVSIENGSSASGVSVRGNSIHSNGIDADGFDDRVIDGIDISPTGLNANDYCDSDTGANSRQNFPVLTSVNVNGGIITIQGGLNSAADKTYDIDFYSCPQCDRSGYGEGKVYLGSGSVTTASGCGVTATPFSITFPGNIDINEPITATATDENGNTSEFSACFGPSAIIEGKLLDANSQPIRAAMVTLDVETTRPDLPHASHVASSTFTNNLGQFKFVNLPLGNDYRVTPTKTNYGFEPTSIAYPSLMTNHNDTYIGNFTGSTLRGKVRLDGSALSGVTLTLTGAANGTTTTSNPGKYSFNNLQPGTYTVTPSRAGYLFTPVLIFLGTDDKTLDFSAAVDLQAGLTGRIVFMDGFTLPINTLNAMNANGSGVAIVEFDPFGLISSTNLSFDGQEIVSGSFFGVAVRNFDGSNLTTILQTVDPVGLNSYTPSETVWSYDKAKIAYVRTAVTFPPPTNQAVYRRIILVMNRDGSNRTSLRPTSEVFDDRSPSFSPNNAKVVFAGAPQANAKLQIHTVDFNPTTNQGTNPQRLTNNAFEDYDPSWSPNGNKIAFARIDTVGNYSIVVINADGSNETTIVPSTSARLGGVCWSPNSTRVLFNRNGTMLSVFANGTGGEIDLGPGGRASWGKVNSVLTPIGTPVTIGSGLMSLTFPGVTGFSGAGANGETTITPISPASAGDPPSGYNLVNYAYDISTTATYTPPATVCFNLEAGNYTTQAQFDNLRVLHDEGGILIDRTVLPNDFANRKICASVNSFSPFVLAELESPAMPSITGLVIDENGNPLTDIPVALSGDEARFTTTDIDGFFTFSNLIQNGNYIVQPTKAGYLFNFPYQSYIGITGEETVVFTATAANFSISGSVFDQDGNPLANVPLTLDGTRVAETTTDVAGNYTFTGLPANGFFSITPLQDGLSFTPPQVSIQSLQDNLSGINFVAGPPPPNQSPNAVSDAATTNQNMPVTIAVLSNDSDPEGDVLTVTNTIQGTNGAVFINVGNTVTYSPNAGFAGMDSFTYAISDERGGSASATVNVTVLQANRPPAVVVQNVTRNADANCQAVVTAQEVGGASSDPDGDAITLILTPAGPFAVGAHSVTVTVTDSHGASASANATVTVIDNTPPVTTCPSNIVAVAAPGQSSAVVNYSASATDNCPNATVTATHPSGSSFPVGVTTVTVTATDAAGTIATCSFTVTVNGSPVQPDKIAFDSTRDGNLEIYSMNADGTNQTRLTSNSALDFKPSWSPDRSKLAFTSSRTGNGDIYVMNANGTNQIRLTSNAAIEDDASWSPDGTKIAFWSNRDGNPEIYVMNANGTNQTRLTSNSAWDTQPKWSPDGTRLAFVSNRNGVLNFDVYVMNANGSQVTRLTTSSSIDESPDWSPDGSKIVFTSNRSNLLDFEIWVMNANGSSQTRLTTSTRSSVRPTWSRDGAQITFATNRLALLNFEIYTMNPNGTSQTRLTTNSALDLNPDR